MKKFDYYKAPSQEIFEDIKKNAMKIWEIYDNTYGYVDEKVNRVKDLENTRDNAWYIVAMFDIHNQRKLFDSVEEKAKVELSRLFEQSYDIFKEFPVD